MVKKFPFFFFFSPFLPFFFLTYFLPIFYCFFGILFLFFFLLFLCFSILKEKGGSPLRKISDIQNDILKLEDELSATIKDQKGKFFKNQDESSFFICTSASVEDGLIMQVLDINPNHKVIFRRERADFEISTFDLIEIS